MSSLPPADQDRAPQVGGNVRRLPTPRVEPPYDAQLRGSRRPRRDTTASIQGTLALSFALPSGVAATPMPPPPGPAALRLVAAGEDDEDAGPRPTPRSELPEPRRWAGRLAQAVVEVMVGERPVAQLVRWTTGEVYEELRQRSTAVTAASAAERTGRGRSVVRSVRVCEPADGVVEAAATVLAGRRYRALVLRLEGLDGRWQCTHVAVV